MCELDDDSKININDIISSIQFLIFSMKLLIIVLIAFLARKGLIVLPDSKWFSRKKDKDKNFDSK